jgi:hypothetical protein
MQHLLRVALLTVNTSIHVGSMLIVCLTLSMLVTSSHVLQTLLLQLLTATATSTDVLQVPFLSLCKVIEVQRPRAWRVTSATSASTSASTATASSLSSSLLNQRRTVLLQCYTQLHATASDAGKHPTTASAAVTATIADKTIATAMLLL